MAIVDRGGGVMVLEREARHTLLEQARVVAPLGAKVEDPRILPVEGVQEPGDIGRGVAVPGFHPNARETHGNDPRSYIGQIQVKAPSLMPSLLLRDKLLDHSQA
eukprot:CAMPEP_0118989176 /NCGR_PEP_ID=MMETSP1173-20130426/47512_1 /TAXON_ID=1034831 /ORGANISM="Rhizochromulina marina cf, Strain CCMP1243" /LENGTH=103 /DNA_ID=CAMNT_0006940149 /DNA_START=86 /DNA_END=396 /DNA_ORIENTATION=+